MVRKNTSLLIPLHQANQLLVMIMLRSQVTKGLIILLRMMVENTCQVVAQEWMMSILADLEAVMPKQRNTKMIAIKTKIITMITINIIMVVKDIKRNMFHQWKSQ